MLKGLVFTQVHLLIFQGLKEALNHGILAGIAGPNHADGKATAPEFLDILLPTVTSSLMQTDADI
jgi:hypothetical protein